MMHSNQTSREVAYFICKTARAAKWSHFSHLKSIAKFHKIYLILLWLVTALIFYSNIGKLLKDSPILKIYGPNCKIFISIKSRKCNFSRAIFLKLVLNFFHGTLHIKELIEFAKQKKDDLLWHCVESFNHITQELLNLCMSSNFKTTKAIDMIFWPKVDRKFVEIALMKRFCVKVLKGSK